MRRKTSKQKYISIKILGIFLNIIIVFSTTALGVFLGLDILWQDIPLSGITNFYQWITLITYRLIIYLAPGFFYLSLYLIKDTNMLAD